MAGLSDRLHFKMMSFVHETLYGLFRDPYEALDAAGLKEGQRVLEVGCGPGFFTVPAAKVVGETGSVCALDISPLAIDRVRLKIEKACGTNVETILADAAHTGLPDASFDLIFVFGFDRNVRQMGNILPELHRLLKPAGTLATEGQLWRSSDLFREDNRQDRKSQFGKVYRYRIFQFRKV